MSLGRRSIRWLLGASLLLLVLATAGWMAATAVQAASDLATAKTLIVDVRSQLLAGDTAAAERTSAKVIDKASTARKLLDTAPWAVVSAIPGVGRPAHTARELAKAVDELASGPLATVVRLGGSLSPKQLHPTGSTVDVDALAKAAPTLATAVTQAQGVLDGVRRLPVDSGLGVINNARTSLIDALERVIGPLQATSQSAQLLPDMLGRHGARRYFIAYQTNAEARGTGGLVGAYAILEANHGKLRLTKQGSDADLRAVTAPVVDLGRDFASHYDQYGSRIDWREANITPDFPSAAAIWAGLWEKQSGQRLDGVIGTDPVALSYILGVTGGFSLPDGEQVSAGNVVSLTERDAYARFPDNAQRKLYLLGIASAVSHKMLDGQGSAQDLVHALGRAVGEGRLRVWSAHRDEQVKLLATPAAGQVAGGTAPYSMVVVNNAAGSKLDYYLERSVSWIGGPCLGSARATTVTVTLTNHAPTAGLPGYVTTRADVNPDGPPGSEHVLLSVFTTTGTQLVGIAQNGKVSTASQAVEVGHPVFTTDVTVQPGRTVTVQLDLLEPTTTGEPRAYVQPLVLPQHTLARVPACRSAA